MVEYSKYAIDRVGDVFFYEVIPNVWHKHIVPLWNGAKDVLFSKELKIDQIKCETEYKVVENQSIFSETMTKEEVDAEKRKLLYHWIGLLSSLTKLRNAGELDVESTLAQLTEPMMIQEFGMDIVTIHSTQSKYFVASRKFELPELKLLIDAVESSKFITKKKSETLIEKIHTMTSPGQASKLKRNNYVVNRIKPDNEQIYYIIDAINDAINAGKQISFQYYDYTGLKKKVLKNKGEVYKFSPYKLLWCGDYYYVLGYSEKKSKVINFRVDRIASKPEILNKDIIPMPDDFDIENYTKEVFFMFSGEKVLVDLRCDNSLMKTMVDRFGEDVTTLAYDMTSFRVQTEVSASPTFFGSQYYYRMLKTQKKELVESEMKELTAPYQNDKLEFIKNPVVAEFLGFSQNTDFTESDLEKSILSNLQKFLMELGKGYAFVARQQHIHTEKQDYYIDLVFYNYILKCFVLIDLKTEKITHQDVGQMDMYIRMYDELKRSEGDNPTIGIVLCSDTDDDIARYSVMHGNEQLFASKYKLYLPTKEELKAEIETQKAMFYLQQQDNEDRNKNYTFNIE